MYRVFPSPAVVARAGDFDGNGMLDLLWQQASDGDCSLVSIAWLEMSKENVTIVSGKLYTVATVEGRAKRWSSFL